MGSRAATTTVVEVVEVLTTGTWLRTTWFTGTRGTPVTEAFTRLGLDGGVAWREGVRPITVATTAATAPTVAAAAFQRDGCTGAWSSSRNPAGGSTGGRARTHARARRTLS